MFFLDNIYYNLSGEPIFTDGVKTEEIKADKRKLSDTNENTEYSIESLTEKQIKNILELVEKL